MLLQAAGFQGLLPAFDPQSRVGVQAEHRLAFAPGRKPASSDLARRPVTRALRTASLKANLPPKEQNYEKALHNLYKNEEHTGDERLAGLQNNLDAALIIAANNGGATAETLPAQPPVYVIAALQDDLQAIKKAARKSTATKLISTYLWRAFLTDRYEAQANDRLFEDFKGLRRCLEQIKDTGDYDEPLVIFNDTEHPLRPPKSLRNHCNGFEENASDAPSPQLPCNGLRATG